VNIKDPIILIVSLHYHVKYSCWKC